MVISKLAFFGMVSMLVSIASSASALLDRAIMFTLDHIAPPGKVFDLHYQPGLADVALAGTAPAYRGLFAPEATYHQRGAARHT